MHAFRSLACLLPLAINLFSQATSTSGDIRGAILDPSGNSLAAAKVTVSNDERGFTRSTVSTAEGRFTITSIPPGIYKVRTEAPGFTTKVVESLEVRVGDVISLLIQLPISTVESEIVVIADIAAV